MARRGLNQGQKAQIASIPAPVGGLNAVDAVAEMPPTDAVVLDNWFPSPSNVAVRNGSSAWATGFGAPVRTLATFNALSGVRKMFAASGGNLYDVSTAGAIGAAVVSGNTSDWWQAVNFGAAGGQYLVMVNGADYPQIFNGTTWQQVTPSSSPISITGVSTSPANFINVNVFGNRLFFIEKNTMRVWYLPLQSVGGAANYLDFSSQTTRGGYLVSMITWTIETSSGSMDMAAFVTSEGEVLLYQGNDPAYAASWSIAGHFRMGRPVGYRCAAKIGSDVALICADGLVPFSVAILSERTQPGKAVSAKIQNLINSDVAAYGATQGWQVILYPIGNKVIVNVPAATGTYQYVMNTLHNAWCRFTGWAANCWEMMGDQLFFGGANAVYLADAGTSDSGASISCVAVQAPNYFGTHANKQFTMARPVISATYRINISFQINADFDTTRPSSSSSFSAPAFSYWGAPWGSSWSPTSVIFRDWQSVGAVGFAGSPAMAFQTQGSAVMWQATDVAFLPGGPI